MGIYVELRYQRPKSDYKPYDRLHIDLRYYYKGRRTRIASGVEVCIKDFSANLKSGWVKRTDKDHQIKNVQVRSRISELERIVSKLELDGLLPHPSLVKKEITVEEVKKNKLTKRELDYYVLVDEYLEVVERDTELKNQTKRTTRSIINQLNEYISQELGYKSRFDLDRFDLDFIDGYKNFSVTKHNRNNSTVSKHLRQLKTFVNWCRERGYTNHIFPKVKISVGENEVLFLNRDEILQLFHWNEFNFDNPNHHKYTSVYMCDELENRKGDDKQRCYTNWEVYKDMLVFGCGVGCRFGDLITLKIDNIKYPTKKDPTEYIRFTQEKTGREVKVPFNTITHTIFKKYSRGKTRSQFVFPLTKTGNLISNQKFNKHLKLLTKVIGLNRLVLKKEFVGKDVVPGTDLKRPIHELVTSHIIRKTFIREGINSSLPHHVIRAMSGHSSEKVFRKYYNTLDSEIHEGMDKMFQYNYHPEHVDETPPSLPTKSDDVTERLKELKNLHEQGLLPTEVYHQKVSKLV